MKSKITVKWLLLIVAMNGGSTPLKAETQSLELDLQKNILFTSLDMIKVSVQYGKLCYNSSDGSISPRCIRTLHSIFLNQMDAVFAEETCELFKAIWKKVGNVDFIGQPGSCSDSKWTISRSCVNEKIGETTRLIDNLMRDSLRPNIIAD